CFAGAIFSGIVFSGGGNRGRSLSAGGTSGGGNPSGGSSPPSAGVVTVAPVDVVMGATVDASGDVLPSFGGATSLAGCIGCGFDSQPATIVSNTGDARAIAQ